MSDELIVCIKKEAGMRVFADKSNRTMVEKLCDELEHIHVYSRAHLDKRDNGVDADGNPMAKGDPEFWQLLPYVIVVHEGQIFTYRRSKKVGESRLAGNTSIGVGGHVAVSEDDISLNNIHVGFDLPAFRNPEDLASTLQFSLERELDEELGLKVDGNVVQGLDFIVDHSNDVGKLHLGMAMKLDWHSWVECNEEELDTVGHLSREELSAMDTHENWTKIVLDMLS